MITSDIWVAAVTTGFIAGVLMGAYAAKKDWDALLTEVLSVSSMMILNTTY